MRLTHGAAAVLASFALLAYGVYPAAALWEGVIPTAHAADDPPPDDPPADGSRAEDDAEETIHLHFGPLLYNVDKDSFTKLIQYSLGVLLAYWFVFQAIREPYSRRR